MLKNYDLKPNLVIPGFPKSGTSSLYDYLGQHPDIFASYRKEPHVYTFKDRYEKRFKNENFAYSFQKFYNKFNGQKYLMDASTTYMISNNALKRLKKDTPEAKFIVIARDPIERIFSHYNWLRMLNYDLMVFEKEIIEDEKNRFNPNSNIKGNYKSYIQFSEYGKQLLNLYDIFDTSQVFVVTLEKLNKDFNGVISSMFSFLELPSIEIKKGVKNKTFREKRVDRLKLPTKLKILEKRFQNNFISNTVIFQKKLKPKKFTVKHEEFIFNLLKEDIKLLKNNNLFFNEWKTVNKYI